jgi:mono/diheme cytochrome c family protein
MSITSPRTRSASVLVWLIACVSTAVLAFATQSQPVAAASNVSSSPVAKHGDEIFHQRCVMCHNQSPNDSLPFGPPNLYTVFRQRTISTQQAETIILGGKGNMPSFRNVLSKSDIHSVIAYLRTTR